jgi:uncharacterized membrane protein HdeD (DUF308 family)
MIEEFQEKQRRKLSRARSFMDTTMGIILILAGLFFLLYRFFGIRLMDRDPSTLDYLIGVLFVAYGGWRIYRGYKKDYYQ